MGARAFAHGTDVFRGAGESDGDLGLMAHELTHVAQQGAAGARTPQRQVQVGDANSPACHTAAPGRASSAASRGGPGRLRRREPVAAGVAGAMGASVAYGVDRREVTGLVTGGPFALVRNPVFSAMLVSAAGVVLLLPDRAAIGAYACLLVAIELQVRYAQEPYLVATHGESSLDYTRQVGRFVPGLGRTLRIQHRFHPRAGSGAPKNDDALDR